MNPKTNKSLLLAIIIAIVLSISIFYPKPIGSSGGFAGVVVPNKLTATK